MQFSLPPSLATAHGTPDLLLPLQDGREREALLPCGTEGSAQGDLRDFVFPQLSMSWCPENDG